MYPLHFQASQTQGLNVYRYLPGREAAVTQHWPGLFQEWPPGPTPFTEYAVNNNMEEMAVYLGLAWRLTAGLSRYAIPAYYRDDAEEALDREPVLVDWEYEIEAEDPHTVRDNGFVPGRSTADRRKPDSWGNTDRAGLFKLSTPRDLVRLLHAVLLDATSEINLFGIAPGSDRRTELVASLSGSERPSLRSVLREADVFVDLTIGSDVGYFDAITVASPADLRLRIDTLAIDFAQRIEAYKSRLDNLPDMRAFLRAVRELAGITLDVA
ncbi:hypothetical protein ACFVHS_32160 [Streptomyces sp. NPDC057746]|uniref:hypothetical protein n=1 Tax=Streptomyces sp. NPDC057746 TaxID=3346237 RepID=UPI0036AC6642